MSVIKFDVWRRAEWDKEGTGYGGEDETAGRMHARVVVEQSVSSPINIPSGRGGMAGGESRSTWGYKNDYRAKKREDSQQERKILNNIRHVLICSPKYQSCLQLLAKGLNQGNKLELNQVI